MDEVKLKLEKLRQRWMNEPDNREEIEEEAKLYKCCYANNKDKKCTNNVYALDAVVCEEHRERHIQTEVRRPKSIEEMQEKIKKMKSRLF